MLLFGKYAPPSKLVTSVVFLCVLGIFRLPKPINTTKKKSSQGASAAANNGSFGNEMCFLAQISSTLSVCFADRSINFSQSKCLYWESTLRLYSKRIELLCVHAAKDETTQLCLSYFSLRRICCILFFASTRIRAIPSAFFYFICRLFTQPLIICALDSNSGETSGVMRTKRCELLRFHSLLPQLLWYFYHRTDCEPVWIVSVLQILLIIQLVLWTPIRLKFTTLASISFSWLNPAHC